MTEYLTQKEIEKINCLIIDRYSPKEPKRVINYNVLDMVVQSVKQEVFGTVLYPTIEEKGANIYMNLATKHPFANANKRTALACLGIFLERNGKLLDVDNNEAVEFTRRVVNEHLDQEIIVDWIKRNTVDI